MRSTVLKQARLGMHWQARAGSGLDADSEAPGLHPLALNVIYYTMMYENHE
jgi:hypothetical protein